jgi:glycosyltransferase involved in cell wall biosynthesis
MPCFNQGKYIDEAIQSVLASTYSNVEIIVVNDGSTDKYTNKILSNSHWEKTAIYTINNSGVSNARNYAISKSNGQYILPLDADDKISSNFILDAVKILDTNSNIKVVNCDVLTFGKEHKKYYLDYSIEKLLCRNTFVVSSIFRRIDYDKIKGFNNNVDGLEDWDFWLSLLERGGEVYKLNYFGFYYRIRNKSRNRSIQKEKYSKIRRQIYENHKELYSKHFFDPLESFEFNLLRDTKEYKLGNFLLKPIRKIFPKF